MAALFQKNQVIKFQRNEAVKLNSIAISAVIEPIGSSENYSYIIEHELGWTPSLIRQTKFELDPAKKYLFVSESELSIPA